jgi:hypothetical protein
MGYPFALAITVGIYEKVLKRKYNPSAESIETVKTFQENFKAEELETNLFIHVLFNSAHYLLYRQVAKAY